MRYARHHSHRLRPFTVRIAPTFAHALSRGLGSSLRSGRKASRNYAQDDGGFVPPAPARRVAHGQRPMIALTLPAEAGILRP